MKYNGNNRISAIVQGNNNHLKYRNFRSVFAERGRKRPPP